MEVTRLTGIALASALMFACAGRVVPGGAASAPALDEQPSPAAVQEVQPEDGESARG